MPAKDGPKSFEEVAAAFASVGFDALLEVLERFGVRDVVADAQAGEVFKAGAVEDLLLRGIAAQTVELLQHQHFKHEHGVEGWFAALAPVAAGIAGEIFEQRAHALPWDEVAQLEDAGGLAGHGLPVPDGAEQSSSPSGPAIAFHPSASLIVQAGASPVFPRRFPEVPLIRGLPKTRVFKKFEFFIGEIFR